jgi:hypothetical protein
MSCRPDALVLFNPERRFPSADNIEKAGAWESAPPSAGSAFVPLVAA